MLPMTFLLVLLTFPSVLFAAPTITGIAPPVGQAGDIVTITGAGFSGDPKQNIVKFGPNRAPVLASTAATLTVQVPNGQPLGPTNVTVSIGAPSLGRGLNNTRGKVFVTGHGGRSQLNGGLRLVQDMSNSVVFTSIARSKIPVPQNPCKCCCCCENRYSSPCPYPCKKGHIGGSVGGRSGDIYAERLEFYQNVTDLSIPGRPGVEEAELCFSTRVPISGGYRWTVRTQLGSQLL
jgi:hypothetical protein